MFTIGRNPCSRSTGRGVHDGPEYASLAETFKTWSDSIWRLKDIAEKAGADVYLAIHAHFDRTLDKVRAVKYRRPGDPHPFVSTDAVDRFFTIMGECTDAQLGRVTE